MKKNMLKRESGEAPPALQEAEMKGASLTCLPRSVIVACSVAVTLALLSVVATVWTDTESSRRLSPLESQNR